MIGRLPLPGSCPRPGPFSAASPAATAAGAGGVHDLSPGTAAAHAHRIRGDETGGPPLDILLYLIAALLVIVGIAGSILPALPGLPLVFGGLFLAAWLGDFQQVGWFTLGLLGALALLAMAVDFLASLLGTRRVGASGLAVLGAAVGTVAGLFFGLVGLLLGPFAGALGGELLAGRGFEQAARAGAGAWLGFLVGTVAKLGLAFSMLGVYLLAWLLP